MKLKDYHGLLGEWPPPGHSLSDPSRLAPTHCLDILLQAARFWRPESNNFGINILTVYEDEKYTRRLPGKEAIFNSVFCEFLNKQRGKTILEISEIDATFLG
jgi:hypothetical protein